MQPKAPSREALTITADLSSELRDRLIRCLDDYLDLCNTVDLPSALAISQGCAALLDVTCSLVSRTTTTTPFQFGEMCVGAYRIHYNSPKEKQSDRATSS